MEWSSEFTGVLEVNLSMNLPGESTHAVSENLCLLICTFAVFDTNACTTFNNADSAGMDTYNYMYPCVTCGKSATEQVTELGKFRIKLVRL